MPLIIKDQAYLDEVIAFAKAEGLYEQPTIRLFGRDAVSMCARTVGDESEIFLLPYLDQEDVKIKIDWRVAKYILRLATDQTKEMVEKSIFADVPDPEKAKHSSMFLKDALDYLGRSAQWVELSKGSFDLPKWSFNVVWKKAKSAVVDETLMFGGLCFFGRDRSSDEESVGWSVHT